MFSVVYDERIAVASIFDEIPEPWVVVDCRPLIDGPGNADQLVQNILQSGLDKLHDAHKVCFACDYGHSRSNYLAALAISRIERISIDTAIGRIKANHSDSSIKPSLVAVKQIKSECNLGKNKFAITGARTYIGQLLAKEIGRLSHKPLLLDAESQPENHDPTAHYQELLDRHQITDVVHCAYPDPPNSYESSKKSYSQFLDLTKACVASSSALHYLSSWSIFEGSIDKEVDEKSCPQPFSLYSQSRCLHEQQLKYSANSSSLKYRVYRLPCLISEDNCLPRFLMYLADSALAGNDIYLHKYMNGYPVIPFMSAKEAVIQLTQEILYSDPMLTLVHICGSVSNTAVIDLGQRIAQACKVSIIETSVSRNALTGLFTSKYSFKRPRNYLEHSKIFLEPIQYVDHYIRIKQLSLVDK
jgi:dTDP-4-dehydrorhamnose reductase